MAIGTTAALVGGSLASAAIGASASKKAGQAAARSADAATALQREMFDETSARFAPFLGAGENALQAFLYEMGLGDRPTFGGTAPQIEEFTTQGPVTIGSTQVGDTGSTMVMNPGPSITRFRVGGQDFETRSAAEEYANANKTGGREYQGYTETPMARYLMERGTDSIQGSAAARGGLFSGATLQALEDNRRQVISADTSDYFSKLLGLTNMGLGAAGNQASAGANFANNAGQSMMAAGQARAAGIQGVGQAFQTGISDMAGIMGYLNPMAAYTAPTMATSPRPMPNPMRA